MTNQSVLVTGILSVLFSSIVDAAAPIATRENRLFFDQFDFCRALGG